MAAQQDGSRLAPRAPLARGETAAYGSHHLLVGFMRAGQL